MNYADLRQEYIAEEFDVKDCDLSPFAQFEKWFAEVMTLDIPDPNAFILCTSSKEGKPSSRIMLLKGVDDKGFVFYTNYLSRKSKEILENPNAAFLFFFKELHRQVRIEGKLEKVSREESEEYFKSRPLESRIGAWASIQSSVISGRQELEDKVKKYTEDYSGKEVPLPDYWGGFRLIPEYFEFWQGRESRLHDRIAYSKVSDLKWNLERLSP